MSKQGMIGTDLAAQEMLDVAETLTDEQWHLPSGAQGWSVKDVVAHVGCLMALLVAAVRGEQTPDNIGIEELNEVQVAAKRGLNGAETMAFVRNELATALETFAPLQEEPLASATTQMQDLGTYPPSRDSGPSTPSTSSRPDLRPRSLAESAMTCGYAGGGAPYLASSAIRKRRLVMPASTGSPIKTQALAAQACGPTSYPVDLAAVDKRAQH